MRSAGGGWRTAGRGSWVGGGLSRWLGEGTLSYTCSGGIPAGFAAKNMAVVIETAPVYIIIYGICFSVVATLRPFW